MLNNNCQIILQPTYINPFHQIPRLIKVTWMTLKQKEKFLKLTKWYFNFKEGQSNKI